MAKKLTEDDVVIIREAWAIRQKALQELKDTECFSVRSLAEKFDVAVGTIGKVVNYETWGSVK